MLLRRETEEAGGEEVEGCGHQTHRATCCPQGLLRDLPGPGGPGGTGRQGGARSLQRPPPIGLKAQMSLVRVPSARLTAHQHQGAGPSHSHAGSDGQPVRKRPDEMERNRALIRRTGTASQTEMLRQGRTERQTEDAIEAEKDRHVLREKRRETPRDRLVQIQREVWQRNTAEKEQSGRNDGDQDRESETQPRSRRRRDPGSRRRRDQESR